MTTRPKRKKDSIIAQNKIFGWIFTGTFALLAVPFIAMYMYDDISWSFADFVIAGALIAGMASTYVFIARHIQSRQRLLVGLLFIAIFLYIWAELAVGVLTTLGS